MAGVRVAARIPETGPVTGCGRVFTTLALIRKALVTDHWVCVVVTRHLCLLPLFWLGLGSNDIMCQKQGPLRCRTQRLKGSLFCQKQRVFAWGDDFIANFVNA